MRTTAPLPGRPAERRHRSGPRQELPVARLLLEAALVEQHLAAQHRHPRAALRLPALVEGPARDAVMIGHLDGPVRVGIYVVEICVGAPPDGAFPRIEPEDARRV